jgi:superkiller protein 3
LFRWFLILVLIAPVVLADTGFSDLAAKAAAARDANRLDEAIADYRQALDLNPNWEEGWWSLGTLYYDSDHYEQAKDALRRLVRLQPNAPPALGLLGLCEFETGEYEQALKHIQASLGSSAARDTQMQQVLLYHEALLLTRTGRFDEALGKYAFFMSHGMPKEDILLSIGLAVLRAPLIPRDVEQGQKEAYVLAGKAAYLRMTGAQPQAEAAFAELLRRFPNFPNVHYSYGLSILANDPNGAIQEFEREVATRPTNSAANAMLGWMLLKRNEFAAALPYAKRAAEVDPRSPIAQFVYGRLLVENGAVEQGIDHLKTAEQIDPEFLESHLSLATAYSRLGRMTEANHERQLSLDISQTRGAVVQH